MAVLGIVADWFPVLFGWVSIPVLPPPLLYMSHPVFGVVGYAILLYCLVAWLKDRNCRFEVRVAFLGIWTVAYLAGLGMATATPTWRQ